MKVLYIESPPGYGGSMQSLLELCYHLPAEVEAHVACPYDVHALRSVPSRVVMHRIERPDSVNSKWRLVRLLRHELGWYKTIMSVYKNVRPDILHFNHIVTYSLGGVVGAWLHRAPVVAHAREYVYSPRIHTLFAGLPRLYIAISRSVASDLERHGVPSSKIRVIYNPVEPPQCSTRPQAARGRLRIGMLGMLKERKGQHILIEALHLLADKGYDFVARIGGSPVKGEEAYLDRLRRMATEYRLQDRLEFVGFVNHPYEFFSAVDIAVHANIKPEPLGRVVVEAMLSGLPVIATDGGGIPEFVEHERTGLLVPMGDARALADALARLIEDGSLREMIGKAAAIKAREMFSPVRHVEGIMECYHSVLRRT